MEKVVIGKAIKHSEGAHVVILSHGPIGNMAEEIRRELAPWAIGHYNFPFVKPMDQMALGEICSKYKLS
jgi:1-deoxy-D-xylulose-5-phosphate synthase